MTVILGKDRRSVYFPSRDLELDGDRLEPIDGHPKSMIDTFHDFQSLLTVVIDYVQIQSTNLIDQEKRGDRGE